MTSFEESSLKKNVRSPWQFVQEKNTARARSHSLVVKADGSRSRGRGLEPRHRILDGC